MAHTPRTHRPSQVQQKLKTSEASALLEEELAADKALGEMGELSEQLASLDTDMNDVLRRLEITDRLASDAAKEHKVGGRA